MGEQSLLLYGIGNPQRNDDGAGQLLAGAVASALGRLGIATQVRLVHQLTPDLAEEIAESDADAVVFADVEAGAVESRVLTLAVSVETGSAQGESNSHTCSPSFVMLLVERLYGSRRRAWLVTVPGTDFGHGETISMATQQALAGAAQLAQAVWKALQPED